MKKTKNLLNPTKAQMVYRNQLWADALRKNKKKARGCMYKDGGRCCLAVAQNVAIAHGVEVDKSHDEYEPSVSVGDFFGWGTNLPYFKMPDGAVQESAMVNDHIFYSANGSTGMSHKRIAECVENTFVHPSNPKWTFKLK